MSNIVLGYTNDLRCHPIRSMLAKGLPVTISPDDPGFYDYEGTTLDYVYCFMAWDLDLCDLKQLAINTIKYSSVSEAEKDTLSKFFDDRWHRFIEFVRGRY